MNRIVLLLKHTNSDIHFLQQLDSPSNLKSQSRKECVKQLYQYIITAYDTVKAVEEENFDLLFDEDSLRHCIKNAEDNAYPNPKNLLKFFDDFTDYREAEDVVENEVIVAGVKYENSILGTMLYSKQAVYCVIDHDAIDPANDYYVKSCPELSECNFTIIKCTPQELHNWFADKRTPQREYDFDYDKHPTHAPECEAPYISSQHYSKNEIRNFLVRAVGVKGDKRRYYKISDSEIAVFCDENLQIKPTFHGYEIKTSNKPEMQKIMKGNLHKKLDILR